VTFGHPLNFFLTFQVKGAGSRSNEAVRHLQDHFSPGAAGALGNGAALHAVTFAQSNNLFSL
jgi:hypothetical protein